MRVRIKTSISNDCFIAGKWYRMACNYFTCDFIAGWVVNEKGDRGFVYVPRFKDSVKSVWLNGKDNFSYEIVH